MVANKIASMPSTFSTISSAGVTADEKYVGAVAVGTKVYFGPRKEDNVGVLDTATSTFSTISIPVIATLNHEYIGAAAVGTKVYFVPYNEDNVGVLDTVTEVFSTISTAAVATTVSA